MATLCLSSSRIVFLHHPNPFLFLKFRPRISNLSGLGHNASAVCFNPLRLSSDRQRTALVSAKVENRRKRGSSVACMLLRCCLFITYSGSPQYLACMISLVLAVEFNAEFCRHYAHVWLSYNALMLARGTGIHKIFVVPLFALQAPLGIISWMKGEYGIWAAFLTLLTRLFFSFPGELELPFIALLLVIVAPYQVMSIRGKQEGAILSLAISCFLAFQHFSRAGSLQKAFDQNSVLATVAIIGTTVVSFLFLI